MRQIAMVGDHRVMATLLHQVDRRRQLRRLPNRALVEMDPIRRPALKASPP
jgi:hypothetical protein